MNFPKAETFPQSVMRERSMGPNPLKLCEELLAYADIPAGSVVLDLGSGAGLTSVFTDDMHVWRKFLCSMCVNRHGAAA